MHLNALLTATIVMAKAVWMVNHGSTIGYAPNSFGEWAEQPQFKNPGLDVSGAKIPIRLLRR